MKIDRAETMFPKDTSPYETKVYEKARDELYKMIKKGDFIQDEEPKYYLYTLIRNGRSQIGLVATCSIDDYLDNVILKHELTREEKEKDRINHVDYCDANTGPIFLTSCSTALTSGSRRLTILLSMSRLMTACCWGAAGPLILIKMTLLPGGLLIMRLIICCRRNIRIIWIILP